MLSVHKVLDCSVGACAILSGVFTQGALAHFEVIGGSALIAWRLVQTFILEPMGIFWPRPRPRRRMRQ